MRNLYFFHSRSISLMMDVQERVFLVTWKIKGRKCEKIRDNFERKFHNKYPKGRAIRELLTKLQRIGSAHDDSRNGRPRNSEERIELVRQAYEEDPLASHLIYYKFHAHQSTEFYDVIWKKKTIPHSGVSQLARRLSTQSSNVCWALDQIESANLTLWRWIFFFNFSTPCI